MDKVELCERYEITYQSLPQTIFEGLFCFFIIAAYVPQYVAIVSKGTFGISSRYILYHALFSVFTLSVRIGYPIYYDEYNCVQEGPYTGWKALSSLLGMIQAVVQFLCAIVLLGLYIHYRSDGNATEDEDERADGAALLPKVPSLEMGLVIGFVGYFVLLVSTTFLVMNQSEMFDRKQLLGPLEFVYIFLMNIWVFPIIIANLAFMVLPFIYQVKTTRALHDHGSPSLVSLGMMAAMFIALAAMQMVRGWRSILSPYPLSDFSSIAYFFKWFIFYYITICTYVAYLAAGVGMLVLLRVCLAERRRAEQARIMI